MCLTCVGRLYCIHDTNSDFCCYLFSPLNQLATAVSIYSRMYISVLSCLILLPRWVELLPLPLGSTITLAELESVPPAASIECTGSHLFLSFRWKLHPMMLLLMRNSWKHLPFCHVFHCWCSHILPILLFDRALSFPGMLPVNVPWTEPMFNHWLQCSSTCDKYLYIPVSQGFFRFPFLTAADCKMANSPLF